MFINILAFICSLAIAAVAAYYSIIGLTSIFAAAIIPVAIMGGVLEAGKLITATWLYDNWKNTPFLLKSYLTLSVVLLMFITSMGIFGFLSKAHIEQTAGAKDGLAKIERIDEDIARLKTAIARSDEKIITIGENAFANNDAIQEQLDKEQLRINNAYARVEPQINEQLAIIETENSNRQKRIASFEADIESLDNELIRLVALTNQYRKELNNADVSSIEEKTAPYLSQIELLNNELKTINETAAGYEEKLSTLKIDNSSAELIAIQIAKIEDQIIIVTNNLQSKDKDKIQQGQAVIGVTSDGLFGNNTRNAYNIWIESQRERIIELQNQILDLRSIAQTALDNEKQRLANLINDLRGNQSISINNSKQEALDIISNIRKDSSKELNNIQNDIQAKIDNIENTLVIQNRDKRVIAQNTIKELQNTESAKINEARVKIDQIRETVNAQILASQNLIVSLRNSLSIGITTDNTNAITIEEAAIIAKNSEIESLYVEKFNLESEYRKYETEVGPVKYIAEFIYREDATEDLLEEAVRWVIIIIISVFDPLAVLLLIAANMGFKKYKNSTKPKTVKKEETVYYENADEVTIDKSRILTL